MNAVARAFGFGNSFSTAAVMMPSVPSEPMNRSLQVVARVVLAQAFEPVPDPPVGQHHLEAERRVRACCRSAAPRCRPRWWRGCRRSGTSPRRRARAGTGSPPPRPRPARSCSMQPASTVMVALTGSTARMRSSRASDSTIAADSGTPPPTSPVLPPCGTIGTPAAAHCPTTKATSAVSRGRTTAERRALIERRGPRRDSPPCRLAAVSTCAAPRRAASVSSRMGEERRGRSCLVALRYDLRALLREPNRARRKARHRLSVSSDRDDRLRIAPGAVAPML